MEQNNFEQNFDAFSTQAQNQMPAKPNNYLALSIISTILGFCSCIGLILGIVAIVMSAQSGSKYDKGDYEGAVKAAKTAKILSLIVLATVILSFIYSWFSIQAIGGWDAYMEMFEEGMRQGAGGM
ncbi:CD225/dispanin family protein [Myroides sp. WP-1]|uniref:CD225/dispanin family protein n=1 Tax=Myroides sp. WP-1 TaxID=2759944 RepID=UPI0015FE1A47|nr:CD225/dispanin family protein [Myroides sp. WP-1]MBB1140789.1 CD225/dispanin family protein [Myroides sp. WP-1]